MASVAVLLVAVQVPILGLSLQVLALVPPATGLQLVVRSARVKVMIQKRRPDASRHLPVAQTCVARWLQVRKLPMPAEDAPHLESGAHSVLMR